MTDIASSLLGTSFQKCVRVSLRAQLRLGDNLNKRRMRIFRDSILEVIFCEKIYLPVLA